MPRFGGSSIKLGQEHHLLQRVGGSYRFVHRLLLDYLADLEINVSGDLTVDQRLPEHNTKKVSRPGILTTAALLLVFVNLLGFIIMNLASAPWFIKVIVNLEYLIGLVAAYGLWKVRRWG